MRMLRMSRVYCLYSFLLIKIAEGAKVTPEASISFLNSEMQTSYKLSTLRIN